MKVKAQVLRNGRWKHHGGVYECTPAKVQHHQKRFAEVTALGYVMPYSIEHDAFELMLASEYEANKTKFLGKATGFEPASDGKGLDAVMDVPDEKDGKYLRGMNFVSPGIRSNVMLGGRTLPGETIVHIAATGHPCQTDQQPIAALSQLVWLSYGADDMADEPKKKEGEGEGEGGGADGEGKKIKCIVKHFNLPDDTTMENLIDRLYTACTIEKSGDGETPPEPTPDTSNPVVMSLTKRLLATEKVQLSQRAKALFTSGRIDKPTLTKLEKELDTVKLSLAPGGTGELAPTYAAMAIKAYEDLPAGSLFGPGADGGTRLSAVDLPDESRREVVTEADAKRVNDEWDKSTATV